MVEEIDKIKDYAQINHIPIMQEEGIEFLTKLIKENKIKKVLEIGTAIAYSAIKIALVDSSIKITTIERDQDRYIEALKNIKKLNLEKQITIIFNDANEVELKDEFDLIFIDAAKAQNKKFFLKFKDNLKKDGYIVTDNINFHGLTKKSLIEIESKNLRGLIRKIKEYISFLKGNKEYTTTFYEIGDGIAISKRNEKDE